MTTSLHITSTVDDFAAWKAAFDKYERFRAVHGVRTYRILRRDGDEHDVQVLLDFDTRDEAAAFREHLVQIWSTPRSRGLLSAHGEPVLLEEAARQSW